MKNEILKTCLLYLFIGLILGSCSTSQNITSCPNFKSKNKKANFTFALNTKKKQKKSSFKIANKSIKKDAISATTKIDNQKSIDPIQSISLTHITNAKDEKFNIPIPQKLTTPIVAHSNSNENVLNNATASAGDFMEIIPIEKLKSLGIDHISGAEGVSTLSKKQIRAIKKQAKKDLKKQLRNDGSSSNAKLAAIIGYLGLIGFLIAYLALHNKGDEFSAFHLRQALGIGILLLLPTFSFGFPVVVFAISSVISIGIFVMWLMGIIGAAQGEQKPVFLLGEFFQKLFSGIK